MAQQQISPEQIPELIRSTKAQLTATEQVLSIKKSCLAHLEQMESYIANGDLNQAMAHFVVIQKSEYELQIAAYEERLAQAKDLVKQLESPSLIAVPKINVKPNIS